MQIGFFGLLGIVFIILKLAGTIAWSWWYVLMPIYIPAGIAIVFWLIVLLIAARKAGW
jgi:hypothetical protein